MKDYINKIRYATQQTEAATRAVSRLGNVLEKGPRTGLVRIGPGIAGLRTAVL